MSTDKRKVATDALETLGNIIGTAEARDAIHLAVEPVEAGQVLTPGHPVVLRDGKAYSESRDKAVGIVDPFLRGAVNVGQRFWLVVMPRTITSLRHVWAHPEFPAEEVHTDPDLFDAKTKSEQWMRAWAIEHMSEDYYGNSNRLSDEAAYDNAVAAGRNNHVGPYEDARDHINSEWWDHWESITGLKGARGEYFSCGC